MKALPDCKKPAGLFFFAPGNAPAEVAKKLFLSSFEGIFLRYLQKYDAILELLFLMFVLEIYIITQYAL